MNQNKLKNLISSHDITDLMPVLFVGHGSPMFAIEENEFVIKWRELGKSIPIPKAILCISAHWETSGTFVTAMIKPPTIHDFGGFPRELYNVQYPAPGSPELAYEVKRIITSNEVGLDMKWGLDHGAWSVIRNIYPDSEVPVIEMSLNWHLTPEHHYELAKELAPLRKKGILIIGSGNIVHNLRMIAWDHASEPEYGFDWALRADKILKDLILDNNHKDLIKYSGLGTEVQMAVPTPDHYLPLLYSLALKEESEPVAFFNDKTVMGSLSMTSIRIG
ncbi:MAG: 4,5-DOPA dioxygenase extradiol [Bacteroidales bacterium]|jgi:4,5-DOPA dioxygenase extradiol